MGKMTVSMAKNSIRRALFEIVDPSPSEKELDQLWRHFSSSCAYCGRYLSRKKKKEAHIDHLVASAEGGRNHIANRVLSCARCNETEKREMPWETFLRFKCTPEEYVERREKIDLWQSHYSADCLVLSREIRDFVHQRAEQALKAFSDQVEQIRAFSEDSKSDHSLKPIGSNEQHYVASIHKLDQIDSLNV